MTIYRLLHIALLAPCVACAPLAGLNIAPANPVTVTAASDTAAFGRTYVVMNVHTIVKSGPASFVQVTGDGVTLVMPDPAGTGARINGTTIASSAHSIQLQPIPNHFVLDGTGAVVSTPGVYEVASAGRVIPLR